MLTDKTFECCFTQQFWILITKPVSQQHHLFDDIFLKAIVIFNLQFRNALAEQIEEYGMRPTVFLLPLSYIYHFNPFLEKLFLFLEFLTTEKCTQMNVGR